MAKKNKGNSRRKIYGGVAIVIIAMIAVAGAWIVTASSSNELPSESNITDNRPEHCDAIGCVHNSVFKALPEYPEDFYDKYIMVYLQRVSDVRIIEEQYWKQPEFYADSFETQGLAGYTQNRIASAGTGPYPSEAHVAIVQTDTLEVTTFWHASWGIHRYQLFSLVTEYPERAAGRLGDVKVEQNPEIASRCFSIEKIPENVLLEPSWPYFHYNWTQKIAARITAKENCPPGKYGIHLFPGPPDDDLRERMEYEIGLTKMSSMNVGGTWEIYIDVIEKPE
ncbi:hypothetical protein ACFL6S_03425 [Candidatus Poribacteria bacterium]